MPDAREDELTDEALDWVARLHSGTATADDHAAFRRWRMRSLDHDAAAWAAERLWREIGETPVAAEFRAEFRMEAAAGRPARTLPRRAVLAGAVAASATGVVLASGAFGPAAGLFADHVTRIGERRRIGLPDGSAVELNTGSALSVAFGEETRRLSLDAGEAVFEVARDPARPFLVTAGGGEAQALGTLFGMRRMGREVGVAALEGQVEVRLESGTRPLVRLEAGQGVRYRPDGFLGAVQPADAALLAWRRGKLIFNQRPLAAVAAELERYQLGRIIVADDRLGAMPVTGVFDLDDPDGTLRTIEQTLPVSILRLPLLTVLS